MNVTDIRFEPTFAEVLKRLLDLSTSKESGPDGVPKILLGNCAVGPCDSVLFVFNKSLETGIFPRIWKE